MPYWYGFRQVLPQPPGAWVASGPYDTHAQALEAFRRAGRAPDAQVLPPFEAEDRTNADRIARERGSS